MAHKGLANITMLENYYFTRLQAIVKELFGQDRSRRAIFWQEVFDHNKPVCIMHNNWNANLLQDNSAIVHNWYSANDAQRYKDVKRAVQKGFQVLVSSCWLVIIIYKQYLSILSCL